MNQRNIFVKVTEELNPWPCIIKIEYVLHDDLRKQALIAMKKKSRSRLRCGRWLYLCIAMYGAL